MNSLILLGGAVALLAYLPLWKQVAGGNVRQNLLSWALWAMLDGIAAATIIFQGGNFLLPLAYAVGGLVTTFVILKFGGRARWTRFESLVSFLVLASIFIWLISGNKMATIASTIGMLIAGMPQLIDAWKNPKNMPLLAYLLYFVANCFSVLGGENWSIEERFYPICGAIYGFTTICFTMLRYKKTATNK